MGTLGEDLKAARENKGLTLKDISERTRISINFLQAIEQDDYSIIPGEVFVTGFLRSYAKELGIPEKEVLARYRETRPVVQEAEPAQPEKPEKPQLKPRPSVISFRRGEKEKGLPLWLIIVIGLIIIAVPAGISLYMTRSKAPNVVVPVVPAPRPMAPATTVFRHASSFRQATALKSRTTAAPKPKAPEKPSPAPAAEGPLTLALAATENTWYAVRADNGQRKSGVLAKGESTTIEAKDRIVLDLGNASGVKIEFNGKALKPYGKRGEVVKGITFTREMQGLVVPPPVSKPEPKPAQKPEQKREKKPVMPQRTSPRKAPGKRGEGTSQRKVASESKPGKPVDPYILILPKPKD